jgi:hypothetical protein
MTRARHDEAVAAVVAAAAQHGHAPVEALLVLRFHGGHDLAAGVFHQDERGDADVLDRDAVGLAHLRGVEDTHAVSVCANCTTRDTLRVPCPHQCCR